LLPASREQYVSRKIKETLSDSGAGKIKIIRFLNNLTTQRASVNFEVGVDGGKLLGLAPPFALI